MGKFKYPADKLTYCGILRGKTAKDGSSGSGEENENSEESAEDGEKVEKKKVTIKQHLHAWRTADGTEFKTYQTLPMLIWCLDNDIAEQYIFPQIAEFMEGEEHRLVADARS